jgi:hypothetical protein
MANPSQRQSRDVMAFARGEMTVSPTRPDSTQVSGQAAINKQELVESDFYFFEQQIAEYSKQIEEPWMARQSMVQRNDPMEELAELYQEMGEIEKKFKRVLEICSKFPFSADF